MIKTLLLLFTSGLCIVSVNLIKETKLLKEDEPISNYYIKQMKSEGKHNNKTIKTFQLEISGPKIKWNIYLVANRNFESLEYKQQASSFKNASYYDCEFRGFLPAYSNSWAALSLCTGIRGIVHLEDGEYEISSSKKITSTTGTVIIRYISHNANIARCEVDANNQNIDGKEQHMVNRGKHRTRRTTNEVNPLTIRAPNITTTSWHRYIEIAVVVDLSLYHLLDSSLTKVHRKCQEIMNIVHGIFRPLEISIVLVRIEVWKDKDKIRVVTDHVETLKKFKSQRIRLLRDGIQHDFSLLLTAIDFIGKTVGYAYVKEMCHPERSAAVVQYNEEESVSSIAGTISHELGHGLGANHDKAFCQTENNSGFGIMIGESMTRLHWSNCSKIYFAKNIDNFHCLRNVPITESTVKFCGNGILDPGEQCDCGINGACSKCCNMVNCLLHKNATCGSGLCCDYKTCKPFRSGTKCRQSASYCDLPEYCSGRSPICPRDVYKMNGYPCDNGNGYCYHGICGSQNLLCQDLINPAAKIPESEIMDRYSHFKQSPCGEFFCQSHLNISWDRDSKAIINDQHYYRYGLSPLIKYKVNESFSENRPRMNGIPCGYGKMCIKKSCVAIGKKMSKYCKNNCSNHGICNSNGNCHCEHKYAPPDCASSGYGGSIDTGHSRHPPDHNRHKILLLLIVFGFIPALMLLCFFWTKIWKLWNKEWYRNAKLTCPTFATIINTCCCPCMNYMTKWTKYIKPNNNNSVTNQESRQFSKTKRTTVCEVNVDIKPPENEIKSWGVASDMLATDVIQVTPKNSPDLRKKIRLPADSPIWRSTSENDNERHRLSETRSKQSDTQSIDDERPDSFTPSMGSLISIFNKFGRQKSKTEDQPAPLSHISGSKSQDLRRMAVDPWSRRPLQESPKFQKNNIPFNRSVSENAHGKNVSPLNPSLLLSRGPYHKTSDSINQKRIPHEENISMNPLGIRSKPMRPLTSRSISHDNRPLKKPPPRPIMPPRQSPSK